MMNKLEICKSRALTGLLVLSLLLNACTSYQPIAGITAESLGTELEQGDHVEITKTDGTVLTFAIDEISAEGISGDETNVSYEEIAQVQVKRMDEEKVEDATLMVLAIPLVVVGIALIAFLAAGSGGAIGFPGP